MSWLLKCDIIPSLRRVSSVFYIPLDQSSERANDEDDEDWGLIRLVNGLMCTLCRGYFMGSSDGPEIDFDYDNIHE